jgi:hypothetical protein
MSHIRSEPSILAESRESVGRGSSADTGRKCPFKDRTGVSEVDVFVVPDELGKEEMCMAKSEPAEARNGPGRVPGKISNALTRDLCSFVPTTGCMVCVVGMGYEAEIDGAGGRT